MYENPKYGTFKIRRGKVQKDCEHCGKWLSNKELEAGGKYCARCAEFIKPETKDAHTSEDRLD